MTPNLWSRAGLAIASLLTLTCLTGCPEDGNAGTRGGTGKIETFKGGGSGAIGTPDQGGSTDPRRGSNAIGAEDPAMKTHAVN